jgi:alpha-D-xyloside xylohydrolase
MTRFPILRKNRARCGLCGGLAVLTAFVSFGALRAASVEKLADGVLVPVGGGFLQLHVKAHNIVRVLYSKERTPRVDDLVVVGPRNSLGARGATARPPKWTLKTTDTTATVATETLQVTVRLSDGAVAFADAAGKPILAEAAGGHRLSAATVQGESTFNVQQTWRAVEDESLYGLGQRQEGKLDIKGYDLDLWQRNMVVAMPFLVSSRGYGILWDNTSFTKFGDTRPFDPIPGANLVTADGQAGGLTEGTIAAEGTRIENGTTVATIELKPRAPGTGGGAQAGAMRAWQGEIVAPSTGDYQIQTYSNGEITLWLDNELRIDQWKQNWATEYDQFKIRLEAGKRYPIRITTRDGDTLRVLWKTPNPSPDTSLWSEVGEAIDYYFVYGPDLDQVVTGYRTLTGAASMLPQWAYGFWQSKNKYNTQDEVLQTLAEFRRRQIPIDAIVQDWQYWRPDAWGSHQFDASRYPDPDAMIRAVHEQHARFMISVWGKFYPNTDNAKALAAIGGLYHPTLKNGTLDWLQKNYAFYDAFSAPARRLFWAQVEKALFSKGVDAWWMDATEPDLVQPSPPTLEALRRDIDRTAVGTASRVLNAYSLVNSEAVYAGQRRARPNQRVFILTRSGFPGIQRYATVTWSGDITSTWPTLRKQITAGLGFSIAGDPYWTTDTGGYTMQSRFARAKEGDALDEWRELNARWFQYSTFGPILRVHGTDRPREMWNLGDDSTPVYQTELKFDRLRYALFPYIYAVAGAVAHEGYTFMRPLVMDFRADARARTIADQFMFGPAFLVSPVTEYKARSRRVYLPAGATWYDFWSGASTPGGQAITADAPYDRIPLHLRAGSIVTFGPAQQYIGEKPPNPLTIYVYAGADGRFSLYEDDGVTYDYEKQQFSRIPLAWNDATRTLTIGARTGTFRGMVNERLFNVVLVTPQTPVGYSEAPRVTRSVEYRGNVLSVTF